MTLTRIKVRICPGAKKKKISKMADGTLKIAVSERAVDGRANEALIAYLAQLLNVSQRCVRIVQGQTSRTKLIEIEGVPAEKIMQVTQNAK